MPDIKELLPSDANFRQLTESFLKLSRTGIVDTSRDYVGLRVPFVLTCESWMSQKPTTQEVESFNFCIDQETGETVDCAQLQGASQGKYILLFCNPSDATFGFPQRASLQKCKGGQVKHTWYSAKRGTYFDELTMNLTFQTGNIMPMIQTGNVVGLRPGQDNFYEFLNLLDQPTVMASGLPNYYYIVYNSPLFPFLTIQGWWDPAGPQLTDNTERMYGPSYTCAFTIHKTFPKISDVDKLRAVFRNAHTSRAPFTTPLQTEQFTQTSRG